MLESPSPSMPDASAPASPDEDGTSRRDAASGHEPDESVGFAHLPERDFFALSLDTTLLPVDLPEDTPPDTDERETAYDKRDAPADGALDTDGEGTDADVPAAVPSGLRDEQDEAAILAHMAQLVEEVAAETGVSRPKAAPTPTAASEAQAENFGADMSATLSELEKILADLAPPQPGSAADPRDAARSAGSPRSVPVPPAPHPAARPSVPTVRSRDDASRRAPYRTPRPSRAPTFVTAYAQADKEDALLPLPDVDIAPLTSGPPATSGPSWNALWDAKHADTPHTVPREATETPLLSFIPPEDEEREEPTPVPAPVEPPASASPKASDAPAAFPAPGVSSASARVEADRPHPAVTPPAGPAPRVRPAARAEPRPPAASRPHRPPAGPRGDESIQRTLAELRRLLSGPSVRDASGGPRRAAFTPTGAPQASPPKPARPSPSVLQPAASPPSSLAADQPTAQAATKPGPTAPGPSPTAPDADTSTLLPVNASSTPGQKAAEPPEAEPPTDTKAAVAPARFHTEAPLTDAAVPADETATSGTTGAADAPVRSMPVSPQPDPADPVAAPVPPATTPDAPAPETAAPSWLGRLAARLKRALRPTPTPAEPAPYPSGASPAPETSAVSAPSPPPAGPVPADNAEAGGLIRRLRDMEAEHRARLLALTERTRGPVYPSREARRNLLHISLAAEEPDAGRTPLSVGTGAAPRSASGPTVEDPAAAERAEDLRVLLDRPSVFRNLATWLRARLRDQPFRDGLRAVGGVAALTAVVGALLYVAMNPAVLDRGLDVVRGLWP